ncbi:MAG: cell division protein FtsH, partial [Verrucomicrobia bacterium]|nr:cell division protein FtsH [Verrucomicrobiota bacterium]
VHSAKIKLAKDVDLRTIARGTPGFSGAELANLLNEGALLAARANKPQVDMEDLEEARDKVRWGGERRSMALSDEEKEITAWHESGHALLTVLLPHTDPLHKVTIIPRGQALGATMSLPKDDVRNRTRNQLVSMIAMAMGGRVAEKLITGDISTGAAGDIKMATQLARNMVCHWGMSERLGSVLYGEDNEYVLLGRDMVRSKEYSNETAHLIDEEIKRFVQEGYELAEDLILKNKDKVELIAKNLLENETLSGEEVTFIIENGRMPDPPKLEDQLNSADEEKTEDDQEEAPEKE